MKMQIIIVQSEIETAIRNHILAQINVREGMQINIDLSATRGADGFRATIDIVPNGTPAASNAPAPSAAPAAAVTASKTSAPAPTKGNPDLDKQTDANQGKEQSPASAGSTAGAAADSAGTAQTAGEDGGAGTGGEAGNASQDSASEAGATDAAQQEGAGSEAEAPKGRSLFGNLQRVKNT